MEFVAPSIQFPYVPTKVTGIVPVVVNETFGTSTFVDVGIVAFGPKLHVKTEFGGPLTVPSKLKLLFVKHKESSEVNETTNASFKVIVSTTVSVQVAVDPEIKVTS